jgi:hypothetical protein
LIVKIYVLYWFITSDRIYKNNIENHVSPSHLIITAHDHDLYEKLPDELKNKFLVIHNGKDLILGQKLMPLTNYNLNNPKSLLFNPWRELCFNLDCSILTMNFVSPSFALNAGRFFMLNANENFYDNLHIHELFEDSRISNKVSDLLTSALNVVKGFPSELAFLELHKRINNPIQFIDQHIKLSNASLCMVSEFIGNTMFDAITNKDISPNEAGKNIIKDIKIYVFHVLWALFTMNVNLNLIHGDLHINNMTFAYYTDKYLENTTELYFGEYDEIYSIPATGAHACIVDFSRSICCNPFLLSWKPTKMIADEYLQDAHYDLLYLIKMYVPDLFAKYENQIYTASYNDFVAMTFIASACDVINFTNALYQLISIYNDKQQYKNELTFLQQIKRSALDKLYNNLTAICEGKLKTVNWCSGEIIKEFFSEYLITTDKLEKNVINVFNSKSKIINGIDQSQTYISLYNEYDNKAKEIE